MQKKLTIEKYTEELFSSAPTPGGGSAAALTGALSAALTAMVFNLTVNKKAFTSLDIEIQNEINNKLIVLEEIKNDFLQMMDKDSNAFSTVIAAYKLPKDNEEAIKTRNIKIEESSEIALQVPLTLAKRAQELYSTILIAAKYGNLNVISDAGVAAYMLHCTIESAVLNVKINLGSISDEIRKSELKKLCLEILKNSIEQKNKIDEIVLAKI